MSTCTLSLAHQDRSKNIRSPPNDEIGLLVSVRSAAEAARALEGGATLIDVKEPLHGSLGRAADHVIREVVRVVGAARPVSAALGEWADEAHTIPTAGLSFIKWGLAGCRQRPDWRASLAQQIKAPHPPQLVLTAYADWQCAAAPPVEEVAALAWAHPGSVLLIDTFCKAVSQVSQRKPTLLDWLPVAAIEDLCTRCREAQVRIALAGSLGLAEIESLLPARPDWFAVRGAVCDAEDRQASIQVDKVRQLAQLLRQGHSMAKKAGGTCHEKK